MFTREWIEGELTRLIIQLHQTEGMISMLRQMLQALDQAELPGMTLEQFEDLLPEGHTVEGFQAVQANEDNHHED